ncbi:DNA ligase LigA-related protein [Peribacillus huizhouensis]|uniref:NAD-dependent DNA ligase adenylation domain-containing protein n=1 Tax=Peribacillus huizhouensis TaxID=1501239 RepID=A0ABR6CR96_9BACI|nr:hypothetical protein [Peribacillus huizhouensis]MBA9027550.1 hypothetical protein [Peribacillus huizhouensis]
MNEAITELIARRRRQILSHSFLYYQMNESIVSDSEFDEWSKELAELQTKHPAESDEAVYAKGFEGFDGASGYDLPYYYPEIQTIGYRILSEHKRRTNI